MLSIRKINSLAYIKNARCAEIAGRIEDCVNSYVKGFYLRCTDTDFFDIEFSSFFSYQFRLYLASRPAGSLSLEEGDEICQLIRDTFNEMKISMDLSPFNILDSSRWNIMRTLEIDFRAKKTPFLTA